MELKDILKNDRTDKCMTQESYARELGITRGTLAYLEKGRAPSAETAKKISFYFDKPISVLLGNEKIKKLSELETTNMIVDSLIEKGEIKKGEISEEAKKMIWATLELEIKLKFEMKEGN